MIDCEIATLLPAIHSGKKSVEVPAATLVG
jgi:hypothetical protein